MTLIGKSVLTIGIAVLFGASFALWQSYGGSVYAAMLTGSPITCL